LGPYFAQNFASKFGQGLAVNKRPKFRNTTWLLVRQEVHT